jgi:DNA-directed RNA polymerase subunit RPC12/RpoP
VATIRFVGEDTAARHAILGAPGPGLISEGNSPMSSSENSGRADWHDIWQLYWNSESSVADIMAAYGITKAHELLRIVGPARYLGLSCRYCGGQVLVHSRAQWQELEKKLREQNASRRRWAAWAFPDVCNECSSLIREVEEEAVEDQRRALEARLVALGRMPYTDYLKTPEWQERRQRALKTAGYRCQACGSGRALQVHHRTYVRRGQELNKDLLVLCGDCHSVFHHHRKLADGGRADGGD